ncbi:Variant-specific surface protein [Giardia duodenalis]|uniref:Variant-specific surface protein n=1 Tax=Giardia intestinalis TaxID=5741 RepID=V6TPE1_GIAIN|nr:Variant-specific surface protein [Giardia intestinalis]
MFDKFLFAGLIMQIAWAACQVQIESSENAQATTQCRTNKCDVTINGNEYCSQCSKNDDHLVNGKCVAAAGDADKGCENPANGVCASCKDGYFMYKGGCYKFAGELGSLICADPESGAAAGKVAGACTNCVAGFFRSPVAAAGKQSCIACNDTTGADNNVGVANCAECTAPATSGSSGTAKCTGCAPGSDSKKPNAVGNSCVPCSPAHCATCSAANTCATCEDGYMLDAKKACVACTVAGCKRCESDGSTGQLCTACTSGTQKPNKEGTKCYECNINGCMYCSEVDTCDQCSDGYKLEGGKCASSSANRSALSTGAIAGISVAAVVVVGGLVGFLCWWFICRGKA